MTSPVTRYPAMRRNASAGRADDPMDDAIRSIPVVLPSVPMMAYRTVQEVMFTNAARKKAEGDMWDEKPASYHLQHACDHMVDFKMSDGSDREWEDEQLDNAITRLVMAKVQRLRARGEAS